MKTYLLKTAAAVIGVMGLLSLSSCLKDKNNNYNPPIALVSFFQAAPDDPALDFYLDNNKVNWGPINYGDGVDYFRAFASKRTANFYLPSTMDSQFSDTLSFKDGNIYSLFLAGPKTHQELVLLNDTVEKPASGRASIRFIDLSPDAPAVDVAVKDSAAFITNKNYKQYTSFTPMPGDKNYTFTILQKGTSTVLATLDNVSIANGGVYTIIFTGLSAGTTNADKLKAFIVTNARYY
ncbi:DUF4397 domain-containing protein [Mucilaginibacter sp.]|uniref:DUF4397 domain-containing protein n=1 Tax=Mucilaginibacter sp. TaxID=1882438 RepID=UPI002CD9F6BD|nr:DUF4397 domain-containing protein [Mucilaginibacter sp.]HTI57766.1 DUF4397 domain-containing protein [Mucilaginibacter sp.]